MTTSVKRSMRSPSPSAQPYGEEEQLNLITNEEDIIAIIKQKENQRWNYGLFVMFIAIATWMIANQLINSVIKSGVYTGQPIFISYTAGSGFVIYLLPEAWNYIKYNIFFKRDTSLIPDGEEDAEEEQSQQEETGLTTRELIVLAAQVSFIYFLNNGLGALALQFTSSSQQVLLSTSTSFFTLVLGSLCKVEVITLSKFGVLALAVAGVALITVNDAQGDDQAVLENPLLGDFLALCASFCYACYLVLIKLRIGETSTKVNERLFFGFIGLSTILLMWPSIFLANYIPVFDHFVPPPDLTIWVIVILNGVLTAISDYCCVIAMLLTSPLIVALLLTTAIPIGMICDSIFYNINNSGFGYYTGMFLILASVVLTNMNDSTIETAIEDALEDAIAKDENLSPLLSPLLSPQLNRGVGARHDFGFEHEHYRNLNSSLDNDNRVHVVSVSGGYNHKYIIKGLNNY